MIVVNRFRVDDDGPDAVEGFLRDLRAAHAALAARAGYVDGTLGRNVDDPGLWLLTTTWENVGSYRRALSSYDVKLTAVPVLSRAVDEPSAYETVAPHDADDSGRAALNVPRPRELG